MSSLQLTVLSLRYSSWSMRPWLALTHAGADFETRTVALSHMQQPKSAGLEPPSLPERREMGSVRGLFPVLRVDGRPIHESLAICEYVADAYPEAGLWPDDIVDRAQARAVCSEMASGFGAMRDELSCHLFARVPGYAPADAATRKDIERVFELWGEALARSGGPFLYGRFTIADAMYFPVLTRFRTYDVGLPDPLETYAVTLEGSPAVQALMSAAQGAPATPIYDDYIEQLGGDPEAGRPAA